MRKKSIEHIYISSIIHDFFRFQYGSKPKASRQKPCDPSSPTASPVHPRKEDTIGTTSHDCNAHEQIAYDRGQRTSESSIPGHSRMKERSYSSPSARRPRPACAAHRGICSGLNFPTMRSRGMRRGHCVRRRGSGDRGRSPRHRSERRNDLPVGVLELGIECITDGGDVP